MAEIQECHHSAGVFPYLLKIWVRDLQHLEHLLSQKIKTLKGVVRVQRSVVLSSPQASRYRHRATVTTAQEMHSPLEPPDLSKRRDIVRPLAGVSGQGGLLPRLFML